MSPNGTLHMDTEAVRAFAARLARFADTLRSTNSRIIRMAEVIDWSGPAHDEFTAEIDKWSHNFRPYIDS
ncbi:MAG: WXG100 family type VII secretion target [Anaerolineales bacterium]